MSTQEKHTGSENGPSPDSDWQSGASNKDPTDLDIADEETNPLAKALGGNRAEWEIDQSTIIKRVADDLYDSPEATVREFIANSETACLRVANGEVDPDVGFVTDDYQPIVEVTFNKAKDQIIFQDNGIGMSPDAVNNVLRHVTRSGVRDAGAYSGQFGMGFLSFAKIIGTDSMMIMKTRSRWTGDNIAASVSLDDFNVLPEQGMPEGQFGSRFEMTIKDGVDMSSIRSWVEKYSEYLRVPVHYEEFDVDGTQTFDEDWGDKTFIDEYGEGKLHTTMTDPGFVEVTASPAAKNRTLLLSMPIERNDSGVGQGDSPFGFDVRLLSEDGVIWKGPNRGKVPVTNGEYDEMEPERQENFVPQREVQSDDLPLPEPTSSRDSLQENERFWQRLSEELRDDQFSEWLAVYENYDSVDAILKAKGSELSIIRQTVDYFTKNFANPLQKVISDKLGITLDDDVIEILKIFNKKVSVVPEETLRPDSDSSITAKNDREEMTVTEVIEASNPGGTVYMGASPSLTKSRIVNDMHENNHVVVVDTDDYEILDALGWEKLKDIDTNDIGKYNISPELFEDLVGSGIDEVNEEKSRKSYNQRKARNRPINMSRMDRSKANKKMTAEKVLDAFNDAGYVDINRNKKADKLLLFPSNSETMVSDNYWLAGLLGSDEGAVESAVANSTVGSVEYLTQHPSIMNVDEYMENSIYYQFDSSAGVTSLYENPDNVVFHVLGEEKHEMFYDDMDKVPEVLETFFDTVHTRSSRLPDNGDIDYENVIYAPITYEQFFYLWPAIQNTNSFAFSSSVQNSKKGMNRIKGDFWLYTLTHLREWDVDSRLMGYIHGKMNHNKMDDGARHLMDVLSFAHDKGFDPDTVDMPDVDDG